MRLPRACSSASLLLAVLIAPAIPAQIAPRLQAGGGAGDWNDGWRPRAVVDGELVSPQVGWLRASLRGSFARGATPSSAPRVYLGTGATIAALVGEYGLFIGSDAVRRAAFRDAMEMPRVTAGGWRRFGDVVISLTTARRSARFATTSYFSRRVMVPITRVDSVSGGVDTVRVPGSVLDSARGNAVRRWSDLQLAVGWQRRRWSAELGLGGRRAGREVPGGAWVSAELALALTGPLALAVGASGTTGGRRFALDAEHRHVTVGFRIAPWSVRAHGVVPSAEAPGASFAALRLNDGRYRLSLRVPRARVVELSGDFTDWKAVTLVRLGDDLWTLTLPLAAGTHRLNIRVDGGQWLPPPGLVTMSDDFAGAVGLLVIESAAAERGGE